MGSTAKRNAKHAAGATASRGSAFARARADPRIRTEQREDEQREVRDETRRAGRAARDPRQDG